MCPCCVPPAHLTCFLPTDPEPCRKWCLCQQGKDGWKRGHWAKLTLEGDPFIRNRCECCMREKGRREEGEKECVTLLGPKVQGVFLQFLLCYGKDDVVVKLGAEEKAAWQTASSSSSLAPTLPDCLCSPNLVSLLS